MNITLPSPVQQIQLPLYSKKGLEVFVKRDDLIHPLVSGNKWRKLKYLLQKALQLNKNHLVTFGGAYSNHLLATASTAHYLNFQATGIVRGEKVDNPLLNTCRDLGMRLIFVDRESYRDKAALFEDFFSEDKTAFFIDEGGASPEAVLGCAEILTEATETFHHVFCAAGTATTAAGIYQSIQNLSSHTQLHVVPVLKNGIFLKSAIEVYLPIDSRLEFHTDFHFGGYAKVSESLLQFIIQYHEETGIILDPVYTGKLVYGLHQLIETNQFKPGERILWIHTGGLYGLLGMQAKFANIDPVFAKNLTSILPKFPA